METYSGFKKKAIKNQPAFYDTSVGSFSLQSPDRAKVEGKSVKLASSALDGLQDMMNINKRFARSFDNLLGEDQRVALIESLRTAMADQKARPITLTIDRSKGEVVDIGSKRHHLQMEGFFEMVERFCDRYSLDIEGVEQKDDLSVTVKTATTGKRVRIADMDDEVFSCGMGFSIKSGVMDFFNYIHRIICSNGMMSHIGSSSSRLKGLGSDQVRDFFDWVDGMAKQHFLPDGFNDRIHRAMATNASVAEAEDVYKTILGCATTDPDMAKVEARRFVPMHRIYDDYKGVGINLREMSRTQKKNAESPVKVWDLINELTYFASHTSEMVDRGFGRVRSEANSLQKQAGRLFDKATLDRENVVASPYTA